MGACRETQNLFFYLKNKNFRSFWYFLKRYNKITHEDTWMPFVCMIKCHNYYIPDENEPDDWACKRCHKFVNYSMYRHMKEQRKKKLKKIKKIW